MFISFKAKQKVNGQVHRVLSLGRWPPRTLGKTQFLGDEGSDIEEVIAPLMRLTCQGILLPSDLS